MSSVSELLQNGKVAEALAAARAEVDAAPADHGARFVLFELLALHDEWSGAREQLSALKQTARDATAGVDLYAGILEAEQARARLLREGAGSVSFLAPPPPWVLGFVNAATLLGKADVQGAAAALGDAWKTAPVVPGWSDGVAFKSIRDADDLLGPFLEVVVPGRYCWVPFAQLSSIRFDKPRGFQDVIWRPAELEFHEGPKARVWVPSVYCGTGSRSDEEKLARLTTFEYPTKGLCRGYGQRDLRLDETLLMGLLSVGSLVIDQGRPARTPAAS